MQLSDFLCYILFTISATTLCVQSDKPPQDVTTERQFERQIVKREAAIIIDNFPAETMASRKPKVVYKRISKQRYRLPKPRYGPARPKYVTTKATRPPTYNKKYKHRKGNQKPTPTMHSKRSPKPRYPAPPHLTIPRNKHKYSNPNSKHKASKQTHFDNHHQAIQEPAGFGEPPSNYEQPSANNGEPPVDSYGAPLNTRLREPYPTTEDFKNINNYELPEKTLGQDYPWPDLSAPDNNYGYSNKLQTFVRPVGLSVFDSQNIGEEQNLNSYADVYTGMKPHFVQPSKKRPDIQGDFQKLINRPWKAAVRPTDDQMLVGGQYAEPPARYVAKFQPSAPMYMEDEESFQPPYSYVESEASATVSPYVNYKNSNMAFSPQNLNDAFSIVDRRR